MSLYRKYRPQTFEDVVGQEHVARTLRNALTATPPRVAHAYLFTGPRGIGKTTNARLLAKCLNCETGPTPVPCNKCDFCTRVAQNQPTMDLIEIDAASHTGVDNIRETIIDKVGTTPAEGRYRVYIIDEVHMLSSSSFNALLKTLEEPPAHAIFILATTETHKVPATITSRCQRFDFRRVTPPDIAKRLQYVAACEDLKLHDEAAKIIARHAEGALRDALTLLEQVAAFSGEEITPADVRLVLGGVPQQLIDDVVDNIGSGDAHGVLETLEKAVAEGASFSQLGRDLTSYLRDLMLMSVGFPGDEGLSNEELAVRHRHVQLLGRGRLETILTALREASKEMRDNVDHRLIVELTLVRASQNTLGVAATAAPTLAPGLRPVAAPAATVWKQPKPVVAPPVATTSVVAPPVTAPPVTAPPVAAPPVAAPSAPVEVERPTSPPPIVEEPVIAATVAEAPVIETPALVEDVPSAAEIVPPPVEEMVAPPEIEVAPVEEEVVAPPPRPKKKGRRIASFEDLTELWPALLDRIRKKIGVTAPAYLHNAWPVGFTNEEVILEFTKEFHYAKACDAAERLGFEKVVNETLDKPRRLKFQLAMPKPKVEAVVEVVQDDDEEVDLEPEGDVIEYARSVFGADIVGRSG
jgi:DNA polymerase-3 subunit gamma/tau